jgi:hypothetical protein
MSDSYSASSHSDGEGVIITGDIRIVQPKKDCDDEAYTTLAGSGKAAAGPKYTNTYAYLGLYKGDIVEAYFKKTGRAGPRIHCAKANWAAIKERLDLDNSLKQLSELELTALIRQRTMEDAPLGVGPLVREACVQSVESLEESPAAEAGAGARAGGAQGGRAGSGTEAWGREVRARTRGVRAEEPGIEEQEQEDRSKSRSRSPGRRAMAVFSHVFHLRLVGLVGLIGVGIFLAYISIAFAFLLIWFIY